MLVEDSLIPETALPVAELRRHLKFGSGFAEDDAQDDVLGSFLRAAMAAIEGRCSKALVQRAFLLTLSVWRDPSRQPLPLAPLVSVTEVAVVDAFGAADVVDPAKYRTEPDSFRPALKPVGPCLPSVPANGSIEVRFQAGYGASFGDLPADLAQAVLMLAAHYYEFRNDTGLSQGCMPFGVTSLIARYRPLRVGGGT